MQEPEQGSTINFSRVNQQYSDLFAKFGDSSSSLMWSRDTTVRFKSIQSLLGSTRGHSLLDYGCGLAHFASYLRSEGETNLEYTGVDINDDFLEYCRFNFPEDKFLDRSSFLGDEATYDYVSVIGTFNLVYSSDYSHQDFVWNEISMLWKKTRAALFLNFMSTSVDYQQGGAFHQDVGDLYEFVSKNLSRKMFIDSTYLPFEYTLGVWRQE
jgi:SAM-dependent methyltransferase